MVQHTEPRLTLLGMRDLDTGQELRPRHAAEAAFCVNSVREFPLGSFQDIVDSFEAISPLSQEGYVVVDASFNRVKVKHPGYVALHHAKDGLSRKAFVEIVRSGETSEVLTAFPEFQPMMDEATEKLAALKAEVQNDYEALKDIPIQKDFALKATQTRCPAALFNVRAKKSESVAHFFKTMRIENLMSLLGYKNDEAA